VVSGSPHTAHEARAKLEWPLVGGADMLTMSSYEYGDGDWLR
jgi:hypothetical protein